ncbi:MAG: succinate dehydrogenase assembly factor 2 [Hyphomicrobiales bacterium]|nr:succinate dehydrogenase assembly factor 2 [Hyphomicrobiales bacterium]
MTDKMENLRKRLIYQSWYRGCKETDRILGPFARQYLPDYGRGQLEAFSRILDESDRDFYDWLTGAQPMPERYQSCPVMQQLVQFVKTTPALNSGN